VEPPRRCLVDAINNGGSLAFIHLGFAHSVEECEATNKLPTIDALAWTESFGPVLTAVNSEWITFVNRRLDQDAKFADRLSACKAPAEMWQTWSEFWVKAADDYAGEAAELLRVATRRAARPTRSPVARSRTSSRKAVIGKSSGFVEACGLRGGLQRQRRQSCKNRRS
jgi:hypothetical protein